MAEIKPTKLHAIMISLPFQGHINPFVNLAIKIASKGITITFVHLEFIHLRLSKAHHNNKTDVDLFSKARESGLDIRYTTIGDDFPLEFDRDLNFPEYWNYLCFGEFPARVDEFVAKTIESDPCSSVHFLVADIICTWPSKIADKYKLVNVGFWTEPAFVFTLAYHWDVIKEKGHGPRKDKMEAVEIDYVPGVESISTKDLMSYITDPDSVVAEGLFAAFMEAKKAEFILVNTVHELEPDTLSALNNKYQPNYAIGPVNFYKTPSTVSKSFWPESDCANWFGSKPAGSVLYVSFGSLVQTSKRVIEEIAYGLILSEVNFIWVVRANIAVGSCDVNVLPVGFEDEIGEKGIIIPWCDQIKVLSNPAVGGFLTHNGWNSTVESMWCGVPMICYPIAYDQFTNRKLVVEDWKIGIKLCEDGGDSSFVDRKQVAQKIKTLMRSHGVREEAEKVREMLRNALQIGGSSERNFDQFVEDLKKKLSC